MLIWTVPTTPLNSALIGARAFEDIARLKPKQMVAISSTPHQEVEQQVHAISLRSWTVQQKPRHTSRLASNICEGLCQLDIMDNNSRTIMNDNQDGITISRSSNNLDTITCEDVKQDVISSLSRSRK